MSVESKVPAIRFKGFSNEWEEKELNELCSLITKQTGFDYSATIKPSLVRQNSSDTYSFIQNKDFSGSSINLATSFYIPKTIAEKFPRILIDVPSILISISGKIGNVGFYQLPIKSFIGGAVGICKLIEPSDGLLIMYQLLSNKGKAHFKSMTKSSSHSNITVEDIRVIQTKIPTIPEEKNKIGNYFQQLDALITQHQKKHDKLLSLRKSLLEKMFPKQGATLPEIRFKGFSGEWEEKALGDNADFAKGQGYSKSDLVEVGSPIILYGRLYTQYQTVIYEVDSFAVENNKSIFSKGYEVIVPASGETAEDISRASAVLQSGVLLGGDLNIINPSNNLDSIFLALTLSNGKPQKDLSRRAQGKSVVHLRNNDLKEVDISYPDTTEQTKIGNLFQQLDTLLIQHQAQLKKLNNIKQACLEKMFV